MNNKICSIDFSQKVDQCVAIINNLSQQCHFDVDFILTLMAQS